MSPELAVFLILALAVPPAYAQDAAQMHAYQESVEVRISPQGDVHVRHVVGDSEEPRQLVLVDGTAANVSVRDEGGNDVAFTAADGGSRVLLPPSENNMVVEYDLLGELVRKDGVWTLDFSYGQTTVFRVPGGVDLILVNGKPIYLGEKDGVACHGCSMLLEYVTDEPRILEGAAWGEDEFPVEIRTLAGIGRFEFDQPAKSISFDVAGKDRFVTVVVPTGLLGGPYAVFLDGKKAYFNEYANNGTHAWIGTRPDSGGSMEIVGTTVIPEFSLMVPLVAGFVMLVAATRFRTVIPR